MRNHRIAKPDFRPCSTCRSRSRSLMPLHSTNDFQPFWGTFGRLRYTLGGDRPSQTAHLTLSRVDKTRRLEFQYSQGGIPPAPPPKLALGFKGSRLSCTNCTKIQYQATVKAPRGLSVLSRVTCIFTGTIISPSLWLRQCPNRYTFRAGRNLPDKEFRYLRTVIVTAAVYWGFSSELRLR